MSVTGDTTFTCTCGAQLEWDVKSVQEHDTNFLSFLFAHIIYLSRLKHTVDVITPEGNNNPDIKIPHYIN